MRRVVRQPYIVPVITVSSSSLCATLFLIQQHQHHCRNYNNSCARQQQRINNMKKANMKKANMKKLPPAAAPQLLGDIEDITPSSTCTQQLYLPEPAAVQQAVKTWFRANRRPLPWRQPSTGTSKKADDSEEDARRRKRKEAAYAVWVSEVMSQQTTMTAVVPYWTEWMKRFPDVEALAAAAPEDVRALWSGLGFYRRADMIHKGAQYIVQQHNEKHNKNPTTTRKKNDSSSSSPAVAMPNTADDLCKVPGIGPYTAGAVASVCFGEVTPVVDGNVLRVVSRLKGSRDFNPKEQRRVKETWADAKYLIQGCVDMPGDFNEGLMELGATLCSPKAPPECAKCPLKAMCRAHMLLKRGDIECIEGVIPVKGTAVAQRDATVACAVIAAADGDSGDGVAGKGEKTQKQKQKQRRRVEKEGGARGVQNGEAVSEAAAGGRSFILAQRPRQGLLASMYEFPTVDLSSVSSVSPPPPTGKKGNAAAKQRPPGTKSGSAAVSIAHSTADAELCEVAKRKLQELLGIGEETTTHTGNNNKKKKNKKAAGVAVASGSGLVDLGFCGEFVHVFSHIRMRVLVFKADAKKARGGGGSSTSAAQLEALREALDVKLNTAGSGNSPASAPTATGISDRRAVVACAEGELRGHGRPNKEHGLSSLAKTAYKVFCSSTSEHLSSSSSRKTTKTKKRARSP